MALVTAALAQTVVSTVRCAMASLSILHEGYWRVSPHCEYLLLLAHFLMSIGDPGG